MSAPAKNPATYADLEAVPPHLVAEILAGELVTHPRPAPRHAVAVLALGREISGPLLGGPGKPGLIFMSEPELHLGFDVIVPDVAGWRRERLPSLPQSAYIETPPDWVCEVLSPSTVRYDRGVKRRIYASAGVSFLWLLDPVSQLLEAFSLSGEHWVLEGVATGANAVSLPPFEAISFPLSVLFPFDEPLPDTPAEG